MSIQENQISFREYFSKEQDQFLVYMASQLKNSLHEKMIWTKISQIFNMQFPNSTKKASSIKNHFDNVINPNLRRFNFSILEEDLFIQYLRQYGCSFQKISKLMKRTENSLKNFFYRNLSKLLSFEEIQQIKTIGKTFKSKNHKINEPNQLFQSCEKVESTQDFQQKDQCQCFNE
jgi:DNA-binding transcriptional MerR regulator